MVKRLTFGYEEEAEIRMLSTAPGQAHWAGSGPDGVMCFQCQHWGRTEAASGITYKRDTGGWLKPKRCTRYRELNHGEILQRGVPAAAWACKYFALKANHPELGT